MNIAYKTLKHYALCIVLCALGLALNSCHDVEPYTDDPVGNFDQLWRILDEHYCFFAEKDIDWDDVYSRYRPRVSNDMTATELFNVCAEMLDELRDGHTNLASAFNTSYYHAWWSDYPQNYNERVVEQYYFNFNYLSIGSIRYGILPENIAYMRYPSFSSTIGEGNLDNILAYCSTADGLIIDIRDNGGGYVDMVQTLVARFIDKPTLAGYIMHKTGPGHNDFSEPYAYSFNPAAEGRIRWAKPVVVLTNRSTFSAANDFVSVMRYLPNVSIVGARTGGGSGMPFNSELSNGWSVRFSACSVLDAQGKTTEMGIDPSAGCAVDLDEEEVLKGRDTMLDFAVNLLINAKNTTH
ncbi:MAG: S41 family peptidase [Muribaculaceae bacterium]|nr:S41 family peptidase [Muribaculaceae bacterium]MCF0213059.1 S41 family peptidase [Muribaculaceae bacterium]